MPPALVYMTNTNRVFHKDGNCFTLFPDSEPRPRLITDIGTARPCYRCYPDVPRVKVLRRYCSECNGKMIQPCEHNGGVQVTVPVRRGKRTLTGEPDEEYNRLTWVWPERARRYN